MTTENLETEVQKSNAHMFPSRVLGAAFGAGAAVGSISNPEFMPYAAAASAGIVAAAGALATSKVRNTVVFGASAGLFLANVSVSLASHIIPDFAPYAMGANPDIGGFVSAASAAGLLTSITINDLAKQYAPNAILRRVGNFLAAGVSTAALIAAGYYMSR